MSWLCSLVGRRAALLSGVAVATVLIQTEYATLRGEHTPVHDIDGRLGVGVDGRLADRNSSLEDGVDPFTA